MRNGRLRHGVSAGNSPAVTVILLTCIFFVSCVARFGMGPLMPAIETGLDLNHGQAGIIFFVTSLGYCLGLLGSAPMAAVFGHRRTVIFSSGSVGAVLMCVAFSTGFAGLAGGMLIVGTGAGLYLPSGIATITDTVPAGHHGKAFAVHEVAPNISMALTPFVVELLLHWTAWRGVVAAFGVAAIAGCLLFWGSGRGSAEGGKGAGIKSMLALLQNPSMWIMIVLFILGVGANVGIYVMLPIFLVSELDIDRVWANSLVAISRGVGLVIVLGAGMLADRWHPKYALVLVLLLAGISTLLLGTGSGMVVVCAVFVLPVMSSAFFPSGYSLLTRFGPLAVSICMPFAFLFGAGGIPIMLGFMGDKGLFNEAMIISGILMLLAAPLTLLVKIDS